MLTAFRPDAIGDQWRGPDLISAGSGRGNVNKPPRADQFQPRLLAGVTCLVESLENLCDFSAPKCL